MTEYLLQMRKLMQNGLKQCALVLMVGKKQEPTHAIIPTQPITCFHPKAVSSWTQSGMRFSFSACYQLTALQTQQEILREKCYHPKAIWVLATLGWFLSNEDSQHCAGFTRLQQRQAEQRRWWQMWNPGLSDLPQTLLKDRYVLIGSQPLKTSCFLWCLSHLLD